MPGYHILIHGQEKIAAIKIMALKQQKESIPGILTRADLKIYLIKLKEKTEKFVTSLKNFPETTYYPDRFNIHYKQLII